MLVSLLVLSCSGNKIEEMKAIHPILKIEVIHVPSVGVVESLHGDVFLKSKGSNEYIAMYFNDTIGIGDILEVRKGAIVKIGFKNGTSMAIDPVEKDRWFTFETNRD